MTCSEFEVSRQSIGITKTDDQLILIHIITSEPANQILIIKLCRNIPDLLGFLRTVFCIGLLNVLFDLGNSLNLFSGGECNIGLELLTLGSKGCNTSSGNFVGIDLTTIEKKRILSSVVTVKSYLEGEVSHKLIANSRHLLVGDNN